VFCEALSLSGIWLGSALRREPFSFLLDLNYRRITLTALATEDWPVKCRSAVSFHRAAMDRLLTLLRAIVCITLCGQERTASRGRLDRAIRGMIKTVGSHLPVISADIFAARMEPNPCLRKLRKLSPTKASKAGVGPKSMRCWLLRTSTHGRAGAITLSFCWPYRQGCAYPR
jgi:hypothetical protein